MIIRRRLRLHSVPPSCSPAVVTAEVVSLFWKADGDDVWSKSDWTVQLEQSNVILSVSEAQLSIVLRMDLSSLYTPHHNVMRRTVNLLIFIIDNCWRCQSQGGYDIFKEQIVVICSSGPDLQTHKKHA